MPSFGINAFVPGGSLKIGQVCFQFEGCLVHLFLFLIEIHVPVSKEWKSWSYVTFLGVWSGPVLFAYVHFYRTLCTSRRWSYYLTIMSRLSNVREILQFHYCNVTVYTQKETVPQGQNRAVCFVTTAQFFYFYFIHKLYFFNTIKCLGSGQKPRLGRETWNTHIFFFGLTCDTSLFLGSSLKWAIKFLLSIYTAWNLPWTNEEFSYNVLYIFHKHPWHEEKISLMLLWNYM